MKFLKDRLLEDKKITVLLDEVAEGKILTRVVQTQPSSGGKPSRGPCSLLLYSHQYCVSSGLPCGSGSSFLA